MVNGIIMDAIFNSNELKKKLLKERHALLDLSTRNRLINVPLLNSKSKIIEIVDEKSSEVFAMLSKGKSMSFIANPKSGEIAEADDVEGFEGLPIPDEELDENGLAARHKDSFLQTKFSPENLQKRTFDMYQDAISIEQEQGVNILYLGLGILKWYDADTSDKQRFAPLILLPVKLERQSAAEKFKLSTRGEPPSINLTLQAKLKQEFNVTIEDFSNEDDVDLIEYCASVAEATKLQKRWEVYPDKMVLGFFSFSKFLMYRDLDAENWPESNSIGDNELVKALLGEGFPETDALFDEDVKIDDVLSPLEMNHIVDADSSQTIAIAEVVAGRNLVVKGPPGTGKSQTITNIIAAAVAKGKKVLFVAEKLAALEVVHRRLKNNGLGDLTLELHSNKAHKKSILEELKRVKESATPNLLDDSEVVSTINSSINILNAHPEKMEEIVTKSGMKAREVLSRSIKYSKQIKGSDLQLVEPQNWTKEDLKIRRELIEDLSLSCEKLGKVETHPWRGVKCQAFDPSEIATLMEKISQAHATLENIIDNVLKASQFANIDANISLSELSNLKSYLDVATVPNCADRKAISDPSWNNINVVSELANSGNEISKIETSINDMFNEAGKSANYDTIRASLVTKGKSLFRFLDGNFKNALLLLKSYLKIELPKSYDERITIIDQILEYQSAIKRYESSLYTKTAFGDAWKESSSKWSELISICEWRKNLKDIPNQVFVQIAFLESNDFDRLKHHGQKIIELEEIVKSQIGELFNILEIDIAKAFGEPSLPEIKFVKLEERVADWRENKEKLSQYTNYYKISRRAKELGLEDIIKALDNGIVSYSDILELFESLYANAMKIELFKLIPQLKEFDGESFERIISRYCDADKKLTHIVKNKVRHKHAIERPKGAGGVGQLGFLNGEIARKRGHKPIRRLLADACGVIQQLKPVFMMSPLSIAQYLQPGAIEFDLLVIDEASQIEPVDALGAVARSKQIVVVGDEKQLPPTSFFKKLSGEADDDQDDEVIGLQVKDTESILDLCLAKGAPYRMLMWHYRSKHQSLITVSNQQFYNNKLFIVPSPFNSHPAKGLQFQFNPEAVYGKGTTRTNPEQATIVANAVMSHYENNPEQSIGVATFSEAQRHEILKRLEILRKNNQSLDQHLTAQGEEPFFVKSIENIQGDERDVILISVGYGKDDKGNLAHNFGPVNREGGERRINVLISRAKQRCVVFSNFRGADIDLSRVNNESLGVSSLKCFLNYAETGGFGLGEASGNEYDSEFEEEVAKKLMNYGYQVETQIGSSGFRVDLAIKDPNNPGRFLLGIECDGVQYHSSKSARDRDRLRQEVLESHGWIIHRIWGADWLLRPDIEMAKVKAAYDRALETWQKRDAGYGSVPPKSDKAKIDVIKLKEVEVVQTDDEDQSNEYELADFVVDVSNEPHLTSVSKLASYIYQIIDMESPIHIDEIATRIRMLWGLKKAGNRIRDAVSVAVSACIKLCNSNFAQGKSEGIYSRLISKVDNFYYIKDREVKVRNRANVGSPSLKKPDMISPLEIETAISQIVRDNFGATEDEVITAVSRQLGFLATSQVLKERIQGSIKSMIFKKSELDLKDGFLTICE